MNFRLTAILFGTIFILAAVLLVISFTGDDKPAADALLEEFIGVKPEDIDTVEFERDGGARLKLVRTDKERNRWDIVEPYTARGDGAAVLELVGALLKAKPVAHPELSGNPAAHGLQPAGLRVILRSGDRSSSVSLGDVTSGARGVVFVTTSARPKRPMATPRSAFEPLFRESGGGKAGDLARWVSDYRARSVFAADTRGAGEDVANISLTHGGKTLALERGGSGWKFLNPAGWGDADSLGDIAATPGTFTGVNRLLGSLTNMQAMTRDDFVPEPKPEDLERYGVNDNSPGVVKVELKNKDGEPTTAFIGKKDVPAAAAPPPHPGMPETGKWWVRVVGQPGVIRAPPDLGGLAAVIDNPDPLRDRTLLAVDRNRIDGIDLANGATKLRKTATDSRNPWRLYGKPEYGDPQAANVEPILNLLTERRTVKSFPAPNPANFAPGELKGTIKLWADGFEVSKDPKADPKAEPKEKGKPIVLEFGKKEADGTIHVRRTLEDGAQAYFLLPEKVKLPTAAEPVDLLATANKPRLELLDSSLKGFAATVATKLAVTGAVNFEVEKDEKPDPYTRGPLWKFLKPDNQKGQTADGAAVEDMLAALANTQAATRLVDENPDAAKLAEYGLGPAPRLRVAVGIKDNIDPADKERVYEFGNPLPGDTNLVYARQAGRTVVFALPKALADRFSGDLRDKTIFRFDPAQVTRVNFKGWKGATGGVQDLHFEMNKDGAWAVAHSTIPGYALDPAKVTAFVNTLSRARVKEFVNGPPTPAMGFGDPKESLNVHLTIAGQPGIILDLWSPTDNGASYFAGVSLRPPTDPVIKLDAAPLKAYKDSPAGFTK